jgi:hypothetical protein
VLRYTHAEKIVLTILEADWGDKAVILYDKTLAKSYGWVFFYQSRKWAETRRTCDGIFGGGPILVNRFKPDVRHITGPGTDLASWLEGYEATLHPSYLKAAPEMPAQ